MDCPAGFTNQHLRRQQIAFMVEHAEVLEPLISQQIGLIYGSQEGGRRHPGSHTGPYSYKGYLRYKFFCSNL
jgi:hypothetical protein